MSVLAAMLIGAAVWALPVEPQEEARCGAAERFLVEQAGMSAVTTADTIDDWRTRKKVPGCRVTAAGLTSRALAEEAAAFYDRLRAAGWTRTPDPRDAPNEASLRFRQDRTDCLFNFYTGTLLGTAAEIEVSNAVVPGYGQVRYNVLVLCMPATPRRQRSNTTSEAEMRAEGRDQAGPPQLQAGSSRLETPQELSHRKDRRPGGDRHEPLVVARDDA